MALLLEICALASIGLIVSGKAVFSKPQPEDEQNERMLKLKMDVQSGRVVPVTRKILMAKYGLGITSIRSVLNQLVDEGTLESDKNKTYRLKTKS